MISVKWGQDSKHTNLGSATAWRQWAWSGGGGMAWTRGGRGVEPWRFGGVEWRRRNEKNKSETKREREKLRVSCPRGVVINFKVSFQNVLGLPLTFRYPQVT